MFDFFQETIPSILKNKLRTALTGFAVAWGIFLLIMLLAFGDGLKNGVMSNFSGRAKNSIAIWPGRTSLGYQGFSPGRKMKFNEKDYQLIRGLDHVVKATPRIIEPAVLSYGEEFGLWDLQGTNVNIMDIRNISMESGRFINDFDIVEKRKVIVINSEIKKLLFKDEDPVGKFLAAGDVMYEVVGIYDQTSRYQDKYEAYIPITTAQTLYCEGDEYHAFDFLITGLDTREANEKYNRYLREKFGQLHTFDPNDRSALYIRNTYVSAIQLTQIVRLIEIFISIVGFASLLAGMIGVSNIMVIIVKERTREIGIRKAIGANPKWVVQQIIFESTIITAVAGYLGLLIGVLLINPIIGQLNSNQESGLVVFKDPSVSITVILVATAVIILSGMISGLIPALKAAKISPIEAMREE